MADLVTLANWKILNGVTSTDATRDAAVELWIDAVSASIEKRLGRTFGSASYTSYLDAPPSRELLLPQGPVTISTLRVYVAAHADGEAAEFTGDTELTVYEDFAPEVDASNAALCTSRVVYRVGTTWGYQSERPPGRLAGRWVPDRGAVKATYTAGLAAPADVQAAAALAVTLLYNGRQFGGPLQSESRGNYSYSRMAAGSVTDAVDAVWPALAVYMQANNFLHGVGYK